MNFFSLVHCLYYNWQLLFDNGDRKKGKKKEEYACTILFISSLEKAWCPARIEPLQTEKKPSWSQGSNPACSDRMPLLYRLRHHRGHFVLVNVMFRISFAKKQQSSLTNSQSCNWFSQFPEMSTNFEILFQSLNFTKVSRASFHCDLTSSHFYRAQVQNNAKEVEKNYFQTYRKKVDGCKFFLASRPSDTEECHIMLDFNMLNFELNLKRNFLEAVVECTPRDREVVGSDATRSWSFFLYLSV